MVIYNLLKLAVKYRSNISSTNFPNSFRYNAQRYNTLGVVYETIDPLVLTSEYGNEIKYTLNADCKRRKETLNTVVERTNKYDYS